MFPQIVRPKPDLDRAIQKISFRMAEEYLVGIIENYKAMKSEL